MKYVPKRDLAPTNNPTGNALGMKLRLDLKENLKKVIILGNSKFTMILGGDTP